MIARYASAITSGTIMTLALFYVMQALIALQTGGPPEERIRIPLMHTVLKDSPVRPDEIVDTFEDLKDPVEPTPPAPVVDESTPRTGVRVTTATPPLDQSFGGSGLTFTDGPLVVMTRVQPAYPVRAATEGLEGYVIVQFDVTTDGRVINVTVVESSHRVFEASAIKAAQRFRYKARVVDGVAIPSNGIRNRFRYEMERG